DLDLFGVLERVRRQAVDVARVDAGVVEGGEDGIEREHLLRRLELLGERGLADADDGRAVLDRVHRPRRQSRCGMTRGSSATAPLPRGRTTRGLMSISSIVPACSTASRCTFMIVSTSALTSADLVPRAPSSSPKPLTSRTMRSASARSNGGTRKVTSSN